MFGPLIKLCQHKGQVLLIKAHMLLPRFSTVCGAVLIRIFGLLNEKLELSSKERCNGYTMVFPPVRGDYP